MFIDRAIIEVRAGKGGNGMISFHKEKYVAKGGPSGGNGGRGGSIYFVASKDVNTLINFRFGKAFIAKDGEDGMTKNRYGRKADDLYIKVPVGTLVFLEETNELIADLKEEGQVEMVAKGGRGGRGNASFKSATNRVPRIAENGLIGEKKRLILELKLLADVGLIGLPNAGKSTFINVVSNAKSEVASYAFTTKSPLLGVVNVSKYESFVLADLPGLIEGASQGKGLGFLFLRHIERCKILLHLVDMSNPNAYENYLLINNELKLYGKNVDKKIQVVVASKMDEDNAKENLTKFKKKYKGKIYEVSSLTHLGIDTLIKEIYKLVMDTKEVELEYESTSSRRIYDAYEKERKRILVVKLKDGEFKIEGEEVLAYYHRLNISTDEGMLKLISYLDKLGIDDLLLKEGAKEGDTVYLEDFAFTYFE